MGNNRLLHHTRSLEVPRTISSHGEVAFVVSFRSDQRNRTSVTFRSSTASTSQMMLSPR